MALTESKVHAVYIIVVSFVIPIRKPIALTWLFSPVAIVLKKLNHPIVIQSQILTVLTVWFATLKRAMGSVISPKLRPFLDPAMLIGGVFYVQEKVRPGTGRETGLGHERYAAGSGMRRSGVCQYRTTHGKGETRNWSRDWPGP